MLAETKTVLSLFSYVKLHLFGFRFSSKDVFKVPGKNNGNTKK